MTKTRGIAALMLVIALAGCSSSRSPVAPAPASQATPQPAPQPALVTVSGYITDTAFRPVAGAHVEVLDGPHAGRVTTTDARGQFQLQGMFDDATRFRATKDAYLAATTTLTPRCATCSGNRFLFFYLAIVDPPVNLAGEYTLTLTADAACTDLPADVLTRTYAATLSDWSLGTAPANTVLKASISGASFMSGYEVFAIGISGHDVAFELRNEGPHLIERIGGDRYLGFEGRADAAVGPSPVSTISTAFSGVISHCVRTSEMGGYYDCQPGPGVTRTQCQSNQHRLTMTRR